MLQTSYYAHASYYDLLIYVESRSTIGINEYTIANSIALIGRPLKGSKPRNGIAETLAGLGSVSKYLEMKGFRIPTSAHAGGLL